MQSRLATVCCAGLCSAHFLVGDMTGGKIRSPCRHAPRGLGSLAWRDGTEGRTEAVVADPGVGLVPGTVIRLAVRGNA